ncbi:unnamed protein product [Candidula unifasciata]|uniref:AMP-dependent synthetase/ligase domain-containing protein n=1 Tax=Candidula unifasciata TaxID=100452 RepID=A0A8S3Z2Q5_9EUPU|nr:unnamed protein product [Candidula unifasciata]
MENIVGSLSRLDTVPKRVQFLADNCPDRELFVFYEGEKRTSFTCVQVFRLAGRFADRLRHRYGFSRNDVILNTLPNSPERMITDLGITLAGCTCMNGQIIFADSSGLFLLATNSRCKGIIMKPADESSNWHVFNPYITGNVSDDIIQLSCDRIPDLTTVITVSRNSQRSLKPFLEDLQDSTDDIFIDPSVSPHDILYVFTTSGSTGYSKLVPRTQAEAIDIAVNTPFSKDVKSGASVFYCDRSLGWAGGYPFSTFCLGDKRVLQDEYSRRRLTTGEEIWDVICREQCNIASIRPMDVEGIVKYICSIGVTDYKLKALVSAGQPLTKAHVINELIISETVVVIYASTEASFLSGGIITDATFDDFYCGKPAPGVELKIIDDHGDECKPRQTGTILAKGGQLFKGYFNRLEDPDSNTVTCFTNDGWLNTDDVGFVDEEGNIYVIGRGTDTITYRKYVLYPGWLEAKILQHPDIADAVILSVLDRFPETFSGKPDKQRLRKLAEQRFGIK